MIIEVWDKNGSSSVLGNQKGIYCWVWAMFVFWLLPDASLQQLVTRLVFFLASSRIYSRSPERQGSFHWYGVYLQKTSFLLNSWKRNSCSTFYAMFSEIPFQTIFKVLPPRKRPYNNDQCENWKSSPCNFSIL